MQVKIGNRYCELRRHLLARHEVAAVMELSEREVRNLQRRGNRLQLGGATDEEIIARGGLPVAHAGRGWAVSPSLLAQHHLVADRPLALEVLGDIVEGRRPIARIRDHDDARPWLLDVVDGPYRSVERSGGQDER